MASSLVKINIHLIFHVKSTSVKMRTEHLEEIFRYIGGVVKHIGGVPIVVGGMPDHVHILTSLPKTMSVSDFTREIKAGSSKWMESLNPCYEKFEWQEGYGAFSVSASQIDKTARYIGGQAEHHQKRTFQEEYKQFLAAYGIQYDERFAFSD